MVHVEVDIARNVEVHEAVAVEVGPGRPVLKPPAHAGLSVTSSNLQLPRLR